MTGSAWIMLLGTWAVIGFFTGKFFLRVLRSPVRSDEPGQQ